MCLILLDFNPERNRRLTVIANRDEFYDRPTQQARRWDPPDACIVAGRDLQAGGTWLGINSATNRFAAVTNYRDGTAKEPSAAKSRGSLPVDFLRSKLSSMDFLQAVHGEDSHFSGYNLLVFDGNALAYHSNRSGRDPVEMKGGLYGLCNHLLDTPWPKVMRGKAAFSDYLNNLPTGEIAEVSALDILLDRSTPPDSELPNTGVGLELERGYSSLQVSIDGVCGTRSSSLVVMDADGPITFVERNVSLENILPKTATIAFSRDMTEASS